MRLLYNLTIFLYLSAIKVYSLFNAKAASWLQGRQQQTIPDLKDKKVIWMHCSSLGEFEQGRPVFERLKKNNTTHSFVLTFFSPSGYEKVTGSGIADYVLYLPIDLPFKVSSFIDKINPELAVFVKYDFWYNYLHFLNKKNIDTIFISVLLNENHRLLKTYNKFLINELKNIKYIFTQNKETVYLLEKMGFSNAVKAGDTRIERVLEIAKSDFSDKKIESFVDTKRKVLIAGSTWKKDIELLASQQDLIFEKYKMIIAPHTPTQKQIDIINSAFKGRAISYYSKVNNENLSRYDILVIDVVGILSKIYRYGNLAYIGGGFGAGIHNTLEPAAYHLPVIIGPKYKRFFEAVQLVKRKSFFNMENSKELKQILLSLESERVYNKATEGINIFLNENKGAVKTIINYL